MKTARYYGIHDIRYEETDMPQYGPDEVLIHVEYAGICGSDLHIYNKGMFIMNIPETMGHEFAGTVAEVGSNVQGFSKGDLVTANPMVPCMKCESCLSGSYNTCENLSFIGECRQGCFAEYIVMHKDTLIRIPNGADPMQAALTEPLAVALNICKKADFRPDDTVAVIGAGPIGLLTIMAAKALYGVKNITSVDLSDERLALAEKIGADHTVKALVESYDKVIDAAGVSATFNSAVNHAKANGKVYVVSIFENDFVFDINTIVAKQISVVGCNVYTACEMREAAEAIASGKINVTPLISHIFDITDCREAFKTAASADKKAAKILMKP